MATSIDFVQYVAEQAGLGDRLTWKRMFGEYGLYIDGTVVAFACDDSLFLKPAAATDTLTATLPRRPPYPAAKPYPIADELLDDSERLREVLLATHAAIPVAKVKPAKSKAAKSTKVAKVAKVAKATKVAKPAAQLQRAKR